MQQVQPNYNLNMYSSRSGYSNPAQQVIFDSQEFKPRTDYAAEQSFERQQQMTATAPNLVTQYSDFERDVHAAVDSHRNLLMAKPTKPTAENIM